MDQDKFSQTQPIPLPGRRRPRPVPRRVLYLLAGAIALIGVLVSWWWSRSQALPPEHPETSAFEAALEPRLDLLDGFRSYDGEDAIRRPLEAAGHLGSDGQLTFEFFNDRLMEIDFRPDDPAAYAPRLHAAVPGLKRDRVGQAELIDGDRRVWSNVDLARSRVGGSLRTDALVIWQDLRLIAQRNDWDERFGSIPVPAKR